MSNTITQMELESDDVMVRAFGDEPVRLRAVGRQGKAVKVVGKDESKAIGFPEECVYVLDQALFGKLREAFEADDARRLSELWNGAERLQ